jgi:hypothetical protein
MRTQLTRCMPNRNQRPRLAVNLRMIWVEQRFSRCIKAALRRGFSR